MEANDIMIIWAILCSLFIVIEVVIPALVSVWFALAAFIVLLLSFFIKDMRGLMFIFAVLSFVFIITLKPFCKRYMKTKDKIERGEVRILAFTDTVQGKFVYDVRYKGGVWTAVSDRKYENGETGKIIKFEGNKIILN